MAKIDVDKRYSNILFIYYLKTSIVIAAPPTLKATGSFKVSTLRVIKVHSNKGSSTDSGVGRFGKLKNRLSPQISKSKTSND